MPETKVEFSEIAKVVKKARTSVGISQSELSHKLDYRNGQFISNCERGLCSIPMKKLRELSRVTKTDVKIFKDAMIKDYKKRLEVRV